MGGSQLRASPTDLVAHDEATITGAPSSSPTSPSASPSAAPTTSSPSAYSKHLVVWRGMATLDTLKQQRIWRLAKDLNPDLYDLVLLRDTTPQTLPSLYTDMTPLRSANVTLAAVLGRFPILDDFLYHMVFKDGAVGSDCCGRPAMWQLFRPLLHLIPTIADYAAVWVLDADADFIQNNRSVLGATFEAVDREFVETDLMGFAFKQNCVSAYGFYRHTPAMESVLWKAGVYGGGDQFHPDYTAMCVSDSLQRLSRRFLEVHQDALDAGQFIIQSSIGRTRSSTLGRDRCTRCSCHCWSLPLITFAFTSGRSARR